MDDQRRARAAGDDPEPVMVQPVVARISIRAFDGAWSAAEDEVSDSTASPSVEWAAARSWAAVLADALPWVESLPSSAELARLLRPGGIQALVAAFAVTLATGDVRLGAAGAAFVGLAAMLRLIDHRVTFSFGSGFVGYRSDMGWPLHVQEDDDFRWHWGPTSLAGRTQETGPG